VFCFSRYTEALRSGVSTSMESYQVPIQFIIFKVNCELELAKLPSSHRLKNKSSASKRNVKDLLYSVTHYIAVGIESIFLGSALISVSFCSCCLFCFTEL
jgi:hypothetical protein